MIGRPLKKIDPDRPLSAAQLNRALQEINQQRYTGLNSEDGRTGFAQSYDPPQTLIAKIASGTNPYAWTAETDQAAAALVDDVSGWVGTTTNMPAYELHAITGVQAGTFVRLWLSTNGDYYWFDGGGWTGTFTALMVSDVSCSGSTLTVTKKTLTIVVSNGWITQQPTFA